MFRLKVEGLNIIAVGEPMFMYDIICGHLWPTRTEQKPLG